MVQRQIGKIQMSQRGCVFKYRGNAAQRDGQNPSSGLARTFRLQSELKEVEDDSK